MNVFHYVFSGKHTYSIVGAHQNAFDLIYSTYNMPYVMCAMYMAIFKANNGCAEERINGNFVGKSFVSIM